MNQQPAKMWSGHSRRHEARLVGPRWRNALLFAILFASMATVVVAQAPDATVTFYSKGSMLTSGLPGTKHGIFYGSIFDGNQRLVTFYEGVFIKNGRFLTVHLPVGEHNFIATNSKQPKNEQRNPTLLEAGKHYFFRAQNESSGIVILEWEKARLDQVSCEVAQEEASRAKPLHPKLPPTSLATMRVSIEAIPSCQ